MKRGSFVAGLAVAVGGGAVVLALLIGLLALSSPKGPTRTVVSTVVATTTVPGVAAASVAPSVVSGARDYVAFACGACHGWKGEGTPSAGVPSLIGVGKAFTEAQLRTIINKGAGVVNNPTKPFMPVWGAVISDQQVADLVAYLKAGLPQISGIATPAVPAGVPASVAGATLYTSLGCINCHGPNGRGGVPNPAAPDQKVPALSGAKFVAQFATDKSIADVILSGSVIGKTPIVDMPHWGSILTPQQVNQLVVYIRTLKTTP